MGILKRGYIVRKREGNKVGGKKKWMRKGEGSHGGGVASVVVVGDH